MKERPILFNGAMVRAIREGRKTVTRRVITPQPEVRMVDVVGPMLTFKNKRGGHWLYPNAREQVIADCPYGQVGDRLWVRETFMDLRGTGIEHRPDPCGPLQRYAYGADCPPGSFADATRKDYGLKWRPSIHMPRDACRLLLEITAVRVERLQDITAAQALAEGVRRYEEHAELGDWYHVDGIETYSACPRKSFELLWESTGGDWAGNPWVWVVEFRPLQPEALAAGEAA